MDRRNFIKSTALPVLLTPVLACGLDQQSDSKFVQSLTNLRIKGIWAYYAPLSSYDGILDQYDNRHPLDRKVDLAAVRRRTSRINGQRSDGTDNRASFTVDELNQAEVYVRVKFWHDDTLSHDRGHTLYIFKRHLDTLAAGEKLFVATGMTQNHFHIVMIEAEKTAL